MKKTRRQRFDIHYIYGAFWNGYNMSWRINISFVLLGLSIVLSVSAQEGTYYFQDSTIAGTGEMVNGVKDGPWVLYNTETQITQSGKFKNDLREGLWKFYDKDDNKTKIDIEKKDQLTSELNHFIDYVVSIKQFYPLIVSPYYELKE